MTTSNFAAEGGACFKYAADSPFPTDILPLPIAAMVRAVAEVHHVPGVMPAVIALSMVSATMGKGRHIPLAPRLYRPENTLFPDATPVGGGCQGATQLKALSSPDGHDRGGEDAGLLGCGFGLAFSGIHHVLPDGGACEAGVFGFAGCDFAQNEVASPGRVRFRW